MLIEEVKEPKTQVLKTTDRCDRCNAQAFVYVEGLEGELFFCAHHFNKYENSIRSYAIEIIDEREFIK